MSINSIFPIQGFREFDEYKYATKFMDYPTIFLTAKVCKSWENFSKRLNWQQFFIEEGIPFVESVGGQLRDYKNDFRILYPITISLKMSERLFGKVFGEVPLISNECFQKCFEVDSIEPKKLRKGTFNFVVVPDVFERASCEEFPFVLDKNGDLITPLESDEWRGKTLQIPNTTRNLKKLCENPLAGRENMPVFNHFSSDVLKQCNTRPNKISVFFMRKCIADETKNMPYPQQEVFVKERGFEVTFFGVRVFFDAVCILTSGTCPDAQLPRMRYARTSDTLRLANDVFQVVIGGFSPGSGVFVKHSFYSTDYIGIAPTVSAEVRAPRELDEKFASVVSSVEGRWDHSFC